MFTARAARAIAALFIAFPVLFVVFAIGKRLGHATRPTEDRPSPVVTVALQDC